MLENHAAEMLARLRRAYEEVAMIERWLSLDETRRDRDRQRSQEAAELATARMLELEKELGDAR